MPIDGEHVLFCGALFYSLSVPLLILLQAMVIVMITTQHWGRPTLREIRLLPQAAQDSHAVCPIIPLQGRAVRHPKVVGI